MKQSCGMFFVHGHTASVDAENSVSGRGRGTDKVVFFFLFFSHQRIPQRSIRTALEKQMVQIILEEVRTTISKEAYSH